MKKIKNRLRYSHILSSRNAISTAVFVLFGAAIFASPALGDTSAEDLKDKLGDIKDKIQAYQKIVDLKQQQRSNLSAQIDALEAQAAKLEIEIGSNQDRIHNLDQEMDRLQNQIAEKEKMLVAQKGILVELMRNYHEDRVQTDFQLLLSTQEAIATMNRNNWTLETGDKVGEMVGNIQHLRDSLKEEYDALESKKSEADSLRLQLQQRTDYLSNAKQSKEVLVAKTQLEEKQYTSKISDLEEQRKDIENEIEDLESAKVDQLDLSKIPAFKNSTLFYPVADPHVSQGYGKTKFTRWYTFHNGIDFTGKVGTPIYAAADGTVIGVGNEGKYAYGKWIAIDHGNGLVTLYGHMSSQGVSKGDKVNKGEKIGLMGMTGYTTGPHVHFTVFAKNSFDIVPSTKVPGITLPTGAHVNPEKYLP